MTDTLDALTLPAHGSLGAAARLHDLYRDDDLYRGGPSGRAPTEPTPRPVDEILAGLQALEDRWSPVEVPATVTLPLWRRILSGTFTGVLILTSVYLWPARFGGATNAVVVRGTSMEPGYELNDIVMVRARDEYEIGDIVLFEIPDGEAAGMRVIHRIVAKHEDGTWMTQGDNREHPDQFHLEDEHLLGTPTFHIPEVGRLLQLASNTYVLSAGIGVGIVFLLWPQGASEAPAAADAPKGSRRRKRGGQDAPATAVVASVPAATSAMPDDVGRAVVIEPAVVEPAVIEPAVIEPAVIEPAVAPREIEPAAEMDVDAAAAAWLAEELAALGIEV